MTVSSTPLIQPTSHATGSSIVFYPSTRAPDPREVSNPPGSRTHLSSSSPNGYKPVLWRPGTYSLPTRGRPLTRCRGHNPSAVAPMADSVDEGSTPPRADAWPASLLKVSGYMRRALPAPGSAPAPVVGLSSLTTHFDALSSRLTPSPANFADYLRSCQLTLPANLAQTEEDITAFVSVCTETDRRLSELLTEPVAPHVPTLILDSNPPPVMPKRPLTVADLMQASGSSRSDVSAPLVAAGGNNPWNYADPEQLVEILDTHTACFGKKEVDPHYHFGFLQKVVLEKPAKVVVHADLHGEWDDLYAFLCFCQAQGWLDAQFHCAPETHFLFLGDYVDRGNGGGKIVLLLALMREENVGKVHLLQGNHECAAMNKIFQQGMTESGKPPSGMVDPIVRALLQNKAHKRVLKAFYETLPLAIFIEHEGNLAQFVHGTCDLLTDQMPLVQHPGSASLTVPRKRALSERVKTIGCEMATSLHIDRVVKAIFSYEVARVKAYLANPEYYNEKRPYPDSYKNLTPYCWGDLGEPDSVCGPVQGRSHQLSLALFLSYFRLMFDPTHNIRLVGRGHEHVPRFAFAKDPKNPHIVTLSYPKKSLPDPNQRHVPAMVVVCGPKWSLQGIDSEHHLMPCVPL